MLNHDCFRSESIKRHSGFTLTELVVVVAVAGILVAFAAPSYLGLVERQRLGTIAAEFSAALERGHSEAVRQSLRATITSIAVDETEWVGWRVQIDGGREIVRRENVLPDQISIIESNAATVVGISADGEVDANYQFVLQNTDIDECRRLLFYPAGTIRLLTEACPEPAPAEPTS